MESQLLRLAVLTTLLFMFVHVRAQNETTTTESQAQKVSPRPLDRRPSFWTKTVDHLKSSTPLRRQHNKATLRRRVEERKALAAQPSTQLRNIMQEFMNETSKLFEEGETKEAKARSYSVEEPQPQVWEDKDQAYHASSFPSADYETGPYHHHYVPSHHPVPVHYYAPQKKDDTLITKFALIALFKLILAKLKAIGILKVFLFFMLKIPLIFFKFLFLLKGLKLLKIVSIPFLIASFFAPFLPLIPLLAPLLLLPLLFLPLLIPLLLPLLLFLPIVPVTTPPTAQGRRRRSAEVTTPSPTNHTWSLMDEKWKEQSDSRARFFKTRNRPASADKASARQEWRYGQQYEQYNQEDSQNLIELTQRVVQSGHCFERVACELATNSDSQTYQNAVVWFLSKILNFAPDSAKKKIERYSRAYETGGQRRSSNYCAERFQCQRPRIVLIQGNTAYNVF